MGHYADRIRALTPGQRARLRNRILTFRGAAGPRLVAYVVPRPGRQVDTAALADSCRRELPDYMVPAAFVCVEALPLTATGKIDRSALPDPFTERPREGRGGAPQSTTERALARVWSDVLGIPGVERHDDFFADLGGHSLLVTRLLAAIHRVLGVDLPVSALFQAPTVAKLAKIVDEEKAGAPTHGTPAIERVSRDTRQVRIDELDK